MRSCLSPVASRAEMNLEKFGRPNVNVDRLIEIKRDFSPGLKIKRNFDIPADLVSVLANIQVRNLEH